ncbi:TIGR02099 family protein [Undibacterium jejuense]|uniref:TIGR02099 family protein n=1 Tax=Undibacterium jejuense TaxID=1344949 RepID=A0A923HFW2_9BURK|nr:YhdP family protein [Undibacterium jejuense]MBC3863281.1 TIGR02099 family protein [Undibacterium jejuense]
MTTEIPATETVIENVDKSALENQAPRGLWYSLSRLFAHTTYACNAGMRWSLRVLVLFYFIFCSLVLVLRYVVLPHVSDYKPQIEKVIGRALGREVHIASLQASWHGLNPHLDLKNVVILDLHGQPALTLPEVNTTLSWLSLVTADLRFETIELKQPALDIVRDPDGKLYVGGFFIDTKNSDSGNNGDNKAVDWILAQRQILISQGAVSWDDRLLKSPILQLTKLNFALQNRWRHHLFALHATPPASVSAPIDIRGDLQHKAFSKKLTNLSSWSGDLYADLTKADLHQLKTYVDYPIEVDKGFGSVRSWLHLDAGRIADFTADLRISDVLGRFSDDLPELDMTEISGRVQLSEKADLGKKYLPSIFGKAGHSIAIHHFSMHARDGSVLPPTTITESFTPGVKGQPESTELYAQYLDLQILANFASHLPLPPDQRQMLTDFSPSGVLKEFTAVWQGNYPNISAYKVKGKFTNLSMLAQPAQLASVKTATTPAKAAVPAIPGFDHLSGTLDANDKGGQFTLDSSDLSLNLSSYFVDPVMPFNRLQMRANWRFDAGDKLVFQVDQMEAQQDSMHLSLTGKHVLPMRKTSTAQPGDADITAHITGFDLKNLDRYVPAATPVDLRNWLIRGILDGVADDVHLRVKGDLAYFPFSANDIKERSKGEFLVKGNLLGAKLDFTGGALTEVGNAPLWPLIDDIHGDFVFDRSRMEINGNTGKTLGADLRGVKAIIPDLITHNPILNIDGVVSSNLPTMLTYVASSPVDAWLGHFSKDTKASGAAGLRLKLQIPLQHVVDTKVNGTLQFSNNEVQLQPEIPLISGINGKLEFNEHGVNLDMLKGSALGGPVVVSGGSQKDNSIRIRVDGTATSDGLVQYLPANLRPHLRDKLNGATRYSTVVDVKQQQPAITIESALQGMGLNFPAPLRKAPNELMPLRVDVMPLANGGDAMSKILQNEIRIQLGNLLHAKYRRQKNIENDTNWKILAGGIGINATTPEPERGLSANVETTDLNVDEWRNLLSSSAGANANDKAKTDAVDAAFDLAPYIAADTLALRTGQLQIFDKQLNNVILGLSHQHGIWQANIDAKQISGHLTWNEPSSGKTMGSISARLSQLIIPQSAASDVGDLLAGKTTGTQIPGLDIIAENFELFNKKMGHLELQANNQINAGVSEWQLSKVVLKNPDAELKASGKWISHDGTGNTQLDYVLDIANTGQLLDRLGFANVMRGGRGRLDGNLKWNGLPYDIDIPSMSGKVQLDLAAGQFLKVDPGAAKLLGVLSMQALPRRLTLDFSDVFSEGFAFDAITGSAQIEQGSAKTDNLKMRGVSATVLMSGTADIVNETQQMQVAVIPVVNAGAASVVYGLAVNPVIGLGTFLAQLFLKEPLARAFTFEYTISGSWLAPQVTKIDHQQAIDAANKLHQAPGKKGE